MATIQPLQKPSYPIINRINPLLSSTSLVVPFYERAGNPRDIINNKQGTLTNSPTWTQTLLGPGINFGGNNAEIVYSSISAYNFTAVGKFSVGIWIQHTTSANAIQGLINKANAGTSGYKIWYDGSNKYLKFEEDSAGFTTTHTNNNSVVLTAGQIYFIVCVYDGVAQAITFYLDGIPLANAVNITWANVVSDTASSIRIGGTGSATNSYAGTILQVVYANNLAWSGTQVWSLYTNPWQIYVKPNYMPFYVLSPATVPSAFRLQHLTVLGIG